MRKALAFSAGGDGGTGPPIASRRRTHAQAIAFKALAPRPMGFFGTLYRVLGSHLRTRSA